MRKTRVRNVKVMALGFATAASMTAANAALIQGVVTFSGVALLDNVNSALATQVSIFLPTVVGVAGDFTPPILVGQTPAITSPLILGVTPGTVWSLGGFTFTPNAPITGGGGPNNTFALGVSGMVDDGPGGFDPTPSIFALASTPTIGGLGAFASITATEARQVGTPEPESFALVAAIGGLGFAAYRRIRPS